MIKSLNARFRRPVPPVGPPARHFPNKQAAPKALYLSPPNADRTERTSWAEITGWKHILNALTAKYGYRIAAVLAGPRREVADRRVTSVPQVADGPLVRARVVVAGGPVAGCSAGPGWRCCAGVGHAASVTTGVG